MLPEVALVTLYVIWAVAFDGTHFFATYSRTVLDPDFRREHSALLRASMTVFVAGPALLAVALSVGGDEAIRAMSFALNRFAVAWAYYHLCRQHYGVIALYRRKQADPDASAWRLETLMMLSGFAYPFLHALIHLEEPLSGAELQWIGAAGWRATSQVLLAVGGLAAAGASWLRASERGRTSTTARLALFGLARVTLAIGLTLPLGEAVGWFRILEHAESGLMAVFGLSVVARMLHGVGARGPIQWPKWAMLAGALATHHSILRLEGVPVLLAMLALTLFHNVQYHRIVRFFSVSQYSGRGPDHFARRATQSPVLFWIAGLAFSTAVLATKICLLAVRDDEIATYMVVAAIWGIPLHHYVLDASIWRPSHSRQVRQMLHTETSLGVRTGDA